MQASFSPVFAKSPGIPPPPDLLPRPPRKARPGAGQEFCAFAHVNPGARLRGPGQNSYGEGNPEVKTRTGFVGKALQSSCFG